MTTSLFPDRGDSSFKGPSGEIIFDLLAIATKICSVFTKKHMTSQIVWFSQKNTWLVKNSLKCCDKNRE